MSVVHRSLKVVKHAKSEASQQEPVYRVTLKSSAAKVEDDTKTFIGMQVVSNSESIFDDFPLDAEFSVTFKQPQTKLTE